MKSSSKFTVWGLHPQGVGRAVPAAEAATATLRFSGFSPRFNGNRKSATSQLQTVNRKLATLESGFTLIELVVVIIIIVVLMGVALDRFMFYQEQAEKVAMEGVVGALDSALILQYGQIMTRGKAGDLAALVRDNPMNWLQKRPRNYSGEFYDPTPLAVESGNWLFDLKSRELIYTVRNRNHFKPGSDGRPWIRFHVATRYDPSRLPSLQAAPPELTGVLLEPVEPYSWF